jgi:hypothetical protein
VNVRRLVLDVDMTTPRPTPVEIAEAISGVAGVEGVNVTVTEIDIQTIGMEVTVEGDELRYGDIVAAIEAEGAVVHSVDEVVAGDRLIERVARQR